MFESSQDELGSRGAYYFQVTGSSYGPFQIAGAGTLNQAAMTTLYIQGTPGQRQTVATVHIGSAQRAGDCHLQIQTLITQQ